MPLSVKSFIKRITPEYFKCAIRKMIFQVNIIRYKSIFILLRNYKKSNIYLQLLTYFKLEIRRFVNVEEHVATDINDLNYLFSKSNLTYYCHPVFNSINETHSSLIEGNYINYYGHVIQDATVIGGSSLILLNEQNALYDISQYNSHKRYRYTDEAIKYHKDNYCLVKILNSAIPLEDGIYLGGNYSWNYYHLMFEFLVKFKQIELLSLNINIPILVDDVCVEIPQYFELFSMLNMNGRDIIVLGKGSRYCIKNLYHISCPNLIPPNFVRDNDVLPDDITYDLETIFYLRNTLIPVSIKSEFPKRIFISREKVSGRRQFNENEVFETLKKTGFQKIFPENYSISDQIAMFNNAELIIGGSGAAFTNLIFCKEACKVIILSKNTLPFSGFSTIAAIVGIKVVYFTAPLFKVEDMKDIHESFYINTYEFGAFIDRWINK